MVDDQIIVARNPLQDAHSDVNNNLELLQRRYRYTVRTKVNRSNQSVSPEIIDFRFKYVASANVVYLSGLFESTVC